MDEPVWKDKELMANPAFKARVMADPKIGPKAKQYIAEEDSRKAKQDYSRNSQAKAPSII